MIIITDWSDTSDHYENDGEKAAAAAAKARDLTRLEQDCFSLLLINIDFLMDYRLCMTICTTQPHDGSLPRQD